MVVGGLVVGGRAVGLLPDEGENVSSVLPPKSCFATFPVRDLIFTIWCFVVQSLTLLTEKVCALAPR